MEYLWTKLFNVALEFLDEAMIPVTDWTFGGSAGNLKFRRKINGGYRGYRTDQTF